eukprot:g4448.t1
MTQEVPIDANATGASKKPNASPKSKPVPFCKLFTYATTWDKILIFTGVSCAFLAGLAQPVIMFAFGDTMEGLSADTNVQDAMESSVRLLAICAGGMTLLFGGGFFCVPLAAVRQAHTMRLQLYKAILKQDMAFFDSKKPGELTVIMNENIEAIEQGLSKKLVELIMSGSQFVLSYIAAFYFSWEMAVSLIGFMPVFVVVAGCMFTVAGGDQMELRKKAYNDAGAIATEAIESIRTVFSFNGEVAMAKRYSERLGKAEQAAVRMNLKVGLCQGILFACMMLMYGCAFLIGAHLVADSRLSALDKYPAPAGYLSTNATNNEWAIHNTIANEACKEYDGKNFESCACNIDFSVITVQGPTLKSVNCGCSHSEEEGILATSPCLSIGSIMSCFFCLLFGSMSLGQFAPAIKAVAKARSMAGPVFDIIERIPDIDVTSEDGIALSTNDAPSIEFKNVHFAYMKPKQQSISDSKEKDKKAVNTEDAKGEQVKEERFSESSLDTSIERSPVFNGLSFKINPGETVAFVGESGCGKSTIGKLVSRLYDCQSNGDILINGTSIKSYNVKRLRDAIGMVSQEPLLFDKSIEENIALGALNRTSVSFEGIKEAAEKANAHNFICGQQFPEHYKTRVGHGGSKLSGGQKQRVAIARGLLRDPQILILDEATSALDTTSERMVQEALKSSQGKRTTIVIAHRLSTVRDADRIIVLGEGDNGMGGGSKIVESGTHSELMVKKGVYYALVGNQDDKSQSNAALAPDAEDNAENSLDEHVKENGEYIDNKQMSSVASEISDSGTKTESKDEKKKRQAEEKALTKRVWDFAEGYYSYLYFGLLCAVITGAIMPAFGYAFAEIISTLSNFNDSEIRQEALQWAIMFWIIAALQIFAQTGQVYGVVKTGEAIVRKLRGTLFRHMLRQEVAFFDNPENSCGSLLSLLSTDTVYIQVVTGHSLASVASVVATLLIALTVAFVSAWQLALCLLLMLPILSAVELIFNKFMMGSEQGAMEQYSSSIAHVSESIRSMREVISFNLGQEAYGIYSNELMPIIGRKERSAKFGAVSMGIANGAMLGFYTVAYSLGGMWIDDGTMSFNNMMKALFVLGFGASGLGQAAAFAGDQSKANVAAKRIFSLLDRKSAIDTKPWKDSEGTEERIVEGNPELISSLNGKIEFRDVKFAYPQRSDAQVFSNLSLTIAPGSTVAFVGSSGSGKSTIIQLMERFYDPDLNPTGNSILRVDDVSLKKLDVKWLRQNIGLVGQEPKLFYGTIAENIGMGKTNSTSEEVIAAAKMANAHDFILRIGGYDVNVGVGGGKLSGGQKQRIAIARAIIKNPKILLLDEATSALDNESEKIVQASLDELLADKGKQRTTIVVAHRLSTIRNCDKIFVLENQPGSNKGSTVVESGTHDELMQIKNGKYLALRNAFDGE